MFWMCKKECVCKIGVVLIFTGVIVCRKWLGLLSAVNQVRSQIPLCSCTAWTSRCFFLNKLALQVHWHVCCRRRNTTVWTLSTFHQPVSHIHVRDREREGNWLDKYEWNHSQVVNFVPVFYTTATFCFNFSILKVLLHRKVKQKKKIEKVKYKWKAELSWPGHCRPVRFCWQTNPCTQKGCLSFLRGY